MRRRVALLVAFVTVQAILLVHAPQSPSLPFPPVATFSILGFDPATGEVGGAVQWLNNDVVLRLQVDDSEQPLKELRRVVEKWNATQRRPR